MTKTKIVSYKCSGCQAKVSTASFCKVSVFCESCGTKMQEIEEGEA